MARKSNAAVATKVEEVEVKQTPGERIAFLKSSIGWKVKSLEASLQKAREYMAARVKDAEESTPERALYSLESIGAALNDVVDYTARLHVLNEFTRQLQENLDAEGHTVERALRETNRRFTVWGLNHDMGGHSSNAFRNAHDTTKSEAFRGTLSDVLSEATYAHHKILEDAAGTDVVSRADYEAMRAERDKILAAYNEAEEANGLADMSPCQYGDGDE